MRDYRGAIIARDKMAAQVGLDRMMGALGIGVNDYIVALREFVVLTPRSLQGARGCRIPNCVLVFDLEDREIPTSLWESLIPAIEPHGQKLRVHRIAFDQLVWPFVTVDDHVFTVTKNLLAQYGNTFPDGLRCSYFYPDGKGCSRRQDQHVPVSIAGG